jgi:PAS domain S-box-containing protein
VESSLAGICIISLDGTLCFCNRMIGELVGWPSKKLLGKKVFAFAHPADRAGAAGYLSRRVRGRPATEQYRVRALHRDGSVRWLEIRSSRILYQGRPAIQGTVIDISDRVRAEDGLRESRERFRRLFDCAPFALFLETITGSIVDCNQAAVDLLGYSRAELLSMSARDLVPKKLADRFPALISRELAAGGFFTEGENIAKDGRVIPVEVSARMIEIEGKKFIIVAVADISPRVRDQAALAAERDRAQTYLDVAGVILVALNERGEVTLINRKGCAVLGRKENEIVGRNWIRAFIPAACRRATEETFHRIMAGNLAPSENYHNPVRTRSGAERMIFWHNTYLRDETGKITGTLSSGEDVTEQFQAEQELKESEASYRTTLQAIRDPLHVVDRNLAVILANPALVEWNRVLGLPTAVTGKSLVKVYPFLSAAIRREYRSVFQTGRPLLTEEKTRVGEREYVTETSKIPIFEKNEVARVITILRDMTEHKQTEARLRDTSKLEAVGTMALGLAHEFNNLLMGISGYAQIAQAAPDDRERIARALEIILRQAQRGKVLIQRLSTFGRRDKPRLAAVELTRILDEVVILQEREMKMTGVKVARVYEDPSPALADYSQMEQVFFNLLRNARQAIDPRGKGTITLTARNRGGEVEVTVADNGIGIRPDDLRRLFEPFFSTKDRQKGDQIPSLGLGLWVSRQIVQAHGGAIAVASRLGKGTVFTIRLPRAPRIPAPAAAALPAIKARAAGRGRNLLVIDDDDDHLDIYRLYLAEREVTVTRAAGGREAIRLCRKRAFDVILLDYVMPGPAGDALIPTLRRFCAGARLYVISGNPVPREERQALAPLVDGWLEKPMDLKKLREVLTP